MEVPARPSSIAASNSAKTITLERPEFEVGNIDFQQNGNSVRFGTFINKNVEVWYADNSDVGSKNVPIDGNRVNRGAQDIPGKIIAVEIDDKDPVTNPRWEGDKYTGSGGGFVDGCVVDPDDVEDEFEDFLKDANKHPYCDGE